MEYMTFEEAKKKKEEMEFNGPCSYCPLIKGRCEQHCICYQPADVQEAEWLLNREPETNETWFVTKGGCINAMYSQGLLEFIYPTGV